VGHEYIPEFLSAADHDAILAFLASLHPIWEKRYSERRVRTEGIPARQLLRPVYWLGSWQFACLDYYRPPRHVHDRCVAAEPFPPVLERIVRNVERRIRRSFRPHEIPSGYSLNTCLINFYGHREEDGRLIDTARVGAHRDFEPGPVASVSIGARALFQFVPPGRAEQPKAPLLTQWLDHGSLQIFGGSQWKDQALHRVQRVASGGSLDLPPRIPGFHTRRVNFTFRYVPEQHVVPLADLREPARGDVMPYVEELARFSPFFARAMDRR